MNTPIYVCNSLSAQMLDEFALLKKEPIDKLPEGLASAIGHADTAHVLGYEPNRINLHFHEGDTFYLAQLQGGRLPEGATTLPEGFTFKYYKCTVVSHTQWDMFCDWIYSCLNPINEREDGKVLIEKELADKLKETLQMMHDYVWSQWTRNGLSPKVTRDPALMGFGHNKNAQAQFLLGLRIIKRKRK